MSCKLCKDLKITQSVTYTAPDLILNVPQTSFYDDNVYCIVVAQSIPDTTTINAPCVLTTGTGTEQYPLVKADGSPVLASDIHSRTRYKVRCETTPTSAIFHMCNRCLCGNNNLDSVSGVTVTTVNNG